MVKRIVEKNIFFHIMNNSYVMLISTILGFLSVIGISVYRLSTDTSAKQEDIYASSVIVTSILFHLGVYFILVGFIHTIWLHWKMGGLFLNSIAILSIVLSPVIISLAIIGLNHSNLAYKEERSKVLWTMNIASGLVHTLVSYWIYLLTKYGS